MNLDERARRAAASVMEQAGRIDTDTILDRVRAERGRRRWLVPAVAVAAAVLAAVVVVLPRSQPDGIEIQPEPVAPGPSVGPSPTASPTEAPPAGGSGTWDRVDPAAFANPGDDRLGMVVDVAGTIIAVGSGMDGADVWRLDPGRPADDPAAWQQVGAELCGEASCELHDATVTGDRLIIVGVLDGLPKTWSSDDVGRTWQRVDVDRQVSGPTVLSAVVADDAGLVAFGSEEVVEGARPVVFTSADGGSWSEAAVDFDTEEAGAWVVDAAVTPAGRTVAVGYVGDGTVLWEERDGAWTARHLSEVDPVFGNVTTMVTSLRRGTDGQLLLTGSARGPEDQDGRVWRSTDDGATWQAMPGELSGAGDQHVTDLFQAGGSMVAVGWTTTDPMGADARPAAWFLGADGWQPMEPGGAFDERGAIQAAVAVGGHGAVAVGHTGSGADQGSESEPADAAVWIYGIGEAAGPARPAGTPGAGECSAADAPAEPTPQPDLPEPVAKMRREIHRAAVACDLPALADLALGGRRGFTYSFGEDGEPSGYWRRLEEDGAAPLHTLVRLLNLPHATVETQFEADRYETLHVWPSAFADDATDGDWEAVVEAGLLTEEEARRMRDGFGAYVGHRVGITDDGEWVFFVAGD